MASPRNKRKRKRGKGRLGPLFKLLCAGAVAVALTMGATVFFQVETVAVTGNSRYSQEEIIQATGIQTGDNLFRMNKFQIAHQVLHCLPYVEEITIRRSLPSTIVITVKEWDAVARIEAPGASAAAAVQAVSQTPAEPAQPDSSQAGDTSQPDAQTGDSSDQSQQEPAPDQSQDTGDQSAAGDSSGDSSAKDDQESAKPATQAWLISVGGKLLEPAPADSTAISVTGITPLAPRAGEMLVLSQEEQPKLTALLALLQGLEDHDMLAVREEEVGHDRAGLVDEGIGRFIVHRVADDIRGDGVRRELDAAGVEAEHLREGQGGRGLADAGDVLHEDVALGQNGH